MKTFPDKTILIVDDADVVVRLNEILLRRTGCTVVTAGSGSEAISMAQHHLPVIAVMDLQMPDMTGDAVTRFFKGRPDLKDIVVVIVTGSDNDESRQKCYDAGAEYFITKPIQPNNLLDLIRSILQRKKSK